MAERYTAPAKGDGDLEERVAQLEAKLKSLTLALGAELQDRPEANGNEETEAKATMDPSHTVLTLNSLASRASAASQQESHVEDDFQLMMSVWDAVICASMGSSSAPGWEVGRADQVLVFLLFCFNITMQTVFILGIATTMNGNPYVGASIPTMKYQRLFDGHDYNQMDRSTMQSRVQKVCTGTWHNRLSATSTNTFQYLQMDGSGVPGQFISLVAMTIWVLSMGKEIRATLDQLAALIMLPNNSQARKSQVISKEEEEVGDTTAGVIADEGGYVIRVMRLPHKIALVLFVYIPRLAIAFTVLWVGTMYLADTAVVSDLILNACALEIVHSVDELVFESVASRKLHQMVEKTRIRYVRGRSLISALLGPENANDKQGVESKSQLLMSARLGMLLVVLVIAYVSHLMPLVNMAEEAYKSICGHEVDFAYVTHPAAGLPVFAAIQSDSSNEVATCYYAAQYEVLSIRVGFDPVHFPRNETLSQLVNGTHTLCNDTESFSCPNFHLATLSKLKAVSAEIYDNPDLCTDQDVLLQVLRSTCLSPDFINVGVNPQFEPIFSCSDLAPHCLCNNATCVEEDFEIANANPFGWVWVDLLSGICPETCKRCKPPLLPLPR